MSHECFFFLPTFLSSNHRSHTVTAKTHFLGVYSRYKTSPITLWIELFAASLNFVHSQISLFLMCSLCVMLSIFWSSSLVLTCSVVISFLDSDPVCILYNAGSTQTNYFPLDLNINGFNEINFRLQNFVHNSTTFFSALFLSWLLNKTLWPR